MVELRPYLLDRLAILAGRSAEQAVGLLPGLLAPSVDVGADGGLVRGRPCAADELVLAEEGVQQLLVHANAFPTSCSAKVEILGQAGHLHRRGDPAILDLDTSAAGEHVHVRYLIKLGHDPLLRHPNVLQPH
eukprot:7408596-Alexandrium_andersonii.AAC.1